LGSCGTLFAAEITENKNQLVIIFITMIIENSRTDEWMCRTPKKLFRYQVWWKERLLGENRLLVYKCLSLF